jgi:hypothetical protein
VDRNRGNLGIEASEKGGDELETGGKKKQRSPTRGPELLERAGDPASLEIELRIAQPSALYFSIEKKQKSIPLGCAIRSSHEQIDQTMFPSHVTTTPTPTRKPAPPALSRRSQYLVRNTPGCVQPNPRK